MQFSIFGDDYSPINVVRMGSCHTLHHTSGAVASPNLWFDPSYREAKVFEFQQPIESLHSLRRTLKRIAASNFRRELVDAIVRYARALDEPDPNTAFVKLWSALETIASPSVANYDVLIKRCSFIFDEEDYHSQVLQHLRDYRNRSVHAGEDVPGAKIYCYQLQNYFRELTLFLLRNGTFFQLTRGSA